MTLYINGEKVGEKDIQEEIERLRPHYEKVFASEDEKEKLESEKQLQDWSRENVIERVLLRQSAMKDKEPVPQEEIEKQYAALAEQAGSEEQFLKSLDRNPEQVKEEITNDLKLQRLIARITEDAPKPTKKEIEKCYEDDPEQYTIPEMIRASHIVKHPEPDTDPEDIRKELEDILAEIKEKDNFAEMASKHSSCPEQAGDLGFFPRGQMVQEFEDVVFDMKPGKISDVFETQFGFHIAKVTSRRSAALCPLTDVQEAIEKKLIQEAQQKALEKFVDAEKEKAAIEEK